MIARPSFRTSTLFAGLALASLAGCMPPEGDNDEDLDELNAAATAAKVAIPKSAVTASADDGAGNVAGNTVDANLATRWSASGDGQWIRYDLGSTKTVAYIRLAPYVGTTRTFTFDIQRSTDGTSWTTVAAGRKTALNNNLQTFDFTDVSARYVRLVGHMNSTSAWNAYTEVEVWTVTPTTVPSGPLGTGWVQYSPTKKIHLNDDVDLQIYDWISSKSVCSPVCADYKYDSTTDTETFRILDNRSNRAEIRLQNEYSSGSRQFQGYVRFDTPLDDESLMQVFGSTTGATQLMIRGYSANNGELRGGGKTLSTGCYGVERRVNMIHRQGQDFRMYINGSLKNTIADSEAVTNYHKYGVYGTLHTGAVTVKWRAARSYKDGQPPG
jgi:hypothetical protein